MKRRRVDSSDEEDSSSDEKERTEDFENGTSFEECDDAEEVPKWVRYLPQRRFLKVPPISVPPAEGFVSSSATARSSGTIAQQLCSQRHRADSAASAGSEMSEVSYHNVVETPVACQPRLDEMDEDDHDDGRGRHKRRRRRRVTFVEYVDITFPGRKEDTTGAVCLDESTADSAADTDGIALLFGEDSRSISAVTDGALSVQVAGQSSGRNVSVTEAALLLSFSDI